jgi:hypothetical protein
MGMPISTAFSNPSITPDEKTSHPRPAIAQYYYYQQK